MQLLLTLQGPPCTTDSSVPCCSPTAARYCGLLALPEIGVMSSQLSVKGSHHFWSAEPRTHTSCEWGNELFLSAALGWTHSRGWYYSGDADAAWRTSPPDSSTSAFCFEPFLPSQHKSNRINRSCKVAEAELVLMTNRHTRTHYPSHSLFKGKFPPPQKKACLHTRSNNVCLAKRKKLQVRERKKQMSNFCKLRVQGLMDSVFTF